MFKRIGLFLITNIAIMVMFGLILNLTGFRGYFNEQGIDYQALLLFCGIWGFLGAFVSLAMSKMMAKWMMGVKIVEPNGPYADLVEMVHRFSKQAGINKMPEVGVYDSPEVNAFATGPSKNNSLVAVSTGLLCSMNRDEVEGVVAHEVGHVANGDMVTMTLVQGVVNTFVLFFAKIAAFAVSNALKGDDDRGGLGYLGYIVTEIAFQIVFGILGSVIVAFYSRSREYRADAAGARLAGREKMVAALQKLKSNYENGVFEHNGEAMSALKISTKPSGFKSLFSTHPPLDARIEALMRRS